MKYTFTFCHLLIAAFAFAQFQIGHLPAIFTDPARNNRAITVEIYYPATTAGDNVPVVSGTFPFVVFGHGFVMDYTAYENITEVLVAEGYVLIYVETEGGFAPVHDDFGLDLAFMADHFYDESANAASLFYNRLVDRCAIMGHSMGGGSTWLAASTSTSVDCIAGLAPAETNPSAIAAASNVTVPAIVFSGSSDAVTAPATNHTPIYEGTASACKYFVNIIDGSHCGYADSGSLCDFGELFFSGLSREEQQAITRDLLLAWFDVYLRDVWTSNELLQIYDETQSNTSTTIECEANAVENIQPIFSIAPNPGENDLKITISSIYAENELQIVSTSGKLVSSHQIVRGEQQKVLDTSSLEAGIYFILMKGFKPVRWMKL